MTMVAVGFMIYMLLDRLSLLHFRSKDMKTRQRTNLVAGSISIHSFFDGVAIGLAFRISDSIGLPLAIAVIAHDFSDGMNTITAILKINKAAKPIKWLLADAIAPAIGVTSTHLFTIRADSFSLLIALFTGFFLYIGAADLLSESQHKSSSLWPAFMTISGIGVMYTVVNFLH